MAKRKKSSGGGCLSSTIGFVAVAGVFGAISTFFEEHRREIIIAGICVAALAVLVAIMNTIKQKDRMDEQLARYKPTSLLSYYQLTDNEEILMKRALLFLGEGMFVFTPHDVGVAGDTVTDNYYKTLITKGYLDRPSRGKYSLNPSHLRRALDTYYATIESKIEATNNVAKSSHFDLAEASKEMYNRDMDQIRIDLEDIISVNHIRQYFYKTDEAKSCDSTEYL